MHPMFKELFIETGDEDLAAEEDRRLRVPVRSGPDERRSCCKSIDFRTVTLSVQGRRLLRDQWEIRCVTGAGGGGDPGVRRGSRGCGTVVCWRWPGPLPDRYAVRARPEAGCMPSCCRKRHAVPVSPAVGRAGNRP